MDVLYFKYVFNSSLNMKMNTILSLKKNLDNCLNSYWYHYIIKYKYLNFNVLKNHEIAEDLKFY